MVEQKICRQCQKEFVVTDEDLEFYKKISPTFAGKTYEIPPPTLCPIDRSRERQSYRNMRSLYKRKCSATGETIYSIFPEDAPFPVYKTDYWWSDKWDPMQFGQDYNPSKKFFNQFKELMEKVPQIARFEFSNENCDYCNGLANNKDCYLSFNLDYCEKGFYLTDARETKDSIDCLGLKGCELCYECIRCADCYNLNYSIRCANCSDSYFLSDCRSCKNCIGCANLTNAEYQIFNKKVTPEEFEKKKKELESREGIEALKTEFEKFQVQFPKKYYYGHSNENFSGDDIRNSKNAHVVYFADDVENCNYCNYVFQAKDCMDYDIFGGNSHHIYNCVATGENCSYDAFCWGCWRNSSNNFYCSTIDSSKNCFGCIGIKHKEYCILNKQYTKEQYEELVARIIEKMMATPLRQGYAGQEWGEFFPSQMSPFAFNETLAYEYYPLEKDELTKRGLRFKEPEDNIPKVEKMIEDADSLPKTIAETTEDVLGWAIKCKQSGRPFMIQGPEYVFYKNKNLPLPRFHPEIRHQMRVKKRNPYLLYHRQCMCEEQGHDHSGSCRVEFETTYAPERSEKVYCEDCYQKSVI